MSRLSHIAMLLTTIALLFNSCDIHTPSLYEKWIGKEHFLSAETLYPEKEILRAWPIVQTEEHFIIWQPENESQFSVFHLVEDSLKYDGAFLSLGRGPFEVNAGEVHYVPENKSVVVVGYNFFGKNFVIPVDDISNLFSHDKWREYNSTLMSSALKVIPVDTLSYLLHIVDETKMFAMLSGQPSTLTKLDVGYPDDKVAPVWEKAAIAYGGSTSKRPMHNQFAYSSYNGHYVAIYTYDENMQITKETTVFDLLPNYSVSADNVRISNNCVDGLSLAVSENYIYLGDKNLVMENYRSDSAMAKNGYPAGHTKTIYVCDWEGNPVAKYELDIAVSYCSIDKNDDYLYAFGFNVDTFESDIVRFKLPDLKK